MTPLESAAATLVYYIKIISAKSGKGLSEDGLAALQGAIDAFREADRELADLRQKLAQQTST